MVKTIPQITDLVIKRLKKEGFVVQRYDAFSTNSVYLKLDYGVCNSIRISDHKGKKHLQYRYNLLSTHKGVKRYSSFGELPRYYYGFDALGVMVSDIVKARELRLNRYGEEQYKEYMETNKLNGKEQFGFWAKCVEV